MPLTHIERLALARQSLDGLSVGDALGGFFEMSHPQKLSHFVQHRQLPTVQWHFTDDTNMALSIYTILRTHQGIDQDALVESFVTRYDRSRGYGRGMRALIARIEKGQHWREASQSFYGGKGSYGNGAAMRVAPIGAYFADDVDAIVNHAQASAEITHAHPEGIAGAIAVALAAGLAFRSRQESPRDSTAFMKTVIQAIPPSEVRHNCELAADLPPNTPLSQVVEQLGNGTDMSAQRTIPLVLWCASTYRHNFEQAIWQTLSAGGDTDTNCAMVGGIVALSDTKQGIPEAWLTYREALPSWALN